MHIFFNSGTIANKIMNIPVWIDLPAEIASKKYKYVGNRSKQEVTATLTTNIEIFKEQ